VILHGDCLDVLKTLEAESIDACVTDPPYGLEFMGKHWDKLWGEAQPANPEGFLGSDGVFRRKTQPMSAHIPTPIYRAGAEAQEWHRQWAVEVLRVLKPGAHLLACGGTRTYHRMASAIEDAGFEIRDCLAWLYGSGFPKSLNLGEGLGTALKPAHEPIVLARKPFKGSVAANVAQHGTGALNIDACRIEGLKPDMRAIPKSTNPVIFKTSSATGTGELSDVGRWPPNVACDDLAALCIDEQSGELTTNAGTYRNIPVGFGGGNGSGERVVDESSGGASRFFYCAKPSREERDMGCYDIEPKQRDDSRKDGNPGGDNPRNRGLQKRGNFHPTVKPIELMRWLIRLVVPINGTVLDPFLGSGTTGVAARLEQRAFIGIEREAEYIAIAERRIAAAAPLFEPTVDVQQAAPTDEQGKLEW
jgi:site-specific DNA-methyltransferase (adenine-specific)